MFCRRRITEATQARSPALSTRWIPTGPKVPQIQWNRLDVLRGDDPMLQDLGDDAWMYFVHSLHGVPNDSAVVAATVEYGTTLNAAFRLRNVFAVCKMSRSVDNGLNILRQ